MHCDDRPFPVPVGSMLGTEIAPRTTQVQRPHSLGLAGLGVEVCKSQHRALGQPPQGLNVMRARTSLASK
jgi:hypothetical protein